jgi:hypothetical protein
VKLKEDGGYGNSQRTEQRGKEEDGHGDVYCNGKYYF